MLAAATAVAPMSWADGDKEHGHEVHAQANSADAGVNVNKDDKDHHDKDDKDQALKADGGAQDDADEGKGEDADEPKEHKAKRRGYIRKMKHELDEAVHANGKDLSDEEAQAIKDHWHATMRLWRIRKLAEADKDKATVARVDALLPKIDDRTLATIRHLNGVAPVVGGSVAPAINPALSPAAPVMMGGAK